MKKKKKLAPAFMFTLIRKKCDTDQLHNLNINPQAVNQIDLNFYFHLLYWVLRPMDHPEIIATSTGVPILECVDMPSSIYPLHPWSQIR